MFPFPKHNHHGRRLYHHYCQPALGIMPMCSFQDESYWSFYLMMDVLLSLVNQFSRLWNRPNKKALVVATATSQRNGFWPLKLSVTSRSPTSSLVPVLHSCDQGDKHDSLLHGGTLIHLCNSLLATLLIVWFLWNHVTMASNTASSSSSASLSYYQGWSMWYIYLSQFGLVYDNGVNAIGRYLGEGQLLRILNKNRFTLHVTVIPLLGITVTEIAGRYSLFDGTMHYWICSILSGWSLFDLTKWHFFCHSQHLHLIDNRAGHANKGLCLSGTLSYTSGAFWEMCIPPVLLVLYELMVGFVILMKTESLFQCMTVNMTLDSLLLLDKASPGHDFACDALPWSAIYLIMSGLLTLSTSVKSLHYPELQLFGENLHGILLWAAYTAP